MPLDIPIPRTIFNVTQITSALSRIIREQPVLQDVWVKGQVSNLSQPSSGHIYFTLKDEKSNIRGVIWKSSVSQLKSLPRDGEEILVQGQIGIYSAGSLYQITVKKAEPLGIGALQREFEDLKQRLSEEGLFDNRYKKPLPIFPKKIGVITSETGAAIQDIQQQLQKRFPLAELHLYPTLVQGDSAGGQIAHAIRVMNNRTDIDVMIVGRGGGSMEDLWAFNEEIVARAIFESRIPVVSAVGHETDFTISDMVADHRSPTPSAAVEHIVPDQQELITQLSATTSRLNHLILQRLTTYLAHLDSLDEGLSPSRRMDTINQLSQSVDGLEVTCNRVIMDILDDENIRLQSLADRLNSLSPLATLKRGYSICRTSDGDIVTSIQQTNVGEQLDVKLAEGGLVCTVKEYSE